MEVRICRCCLSPGIHKDLNTSYLWLNKKEVYSEMLQECFNIALKISDYSNMAICEECIKTLRSSCHFKRKVLQNEQELLKTLPGVQDNDQKPIEVKLEPPLDDGDDSDDYSLSDADQKPIEVKLEPPLDDRDESDDYSLSDAAQKPIEVKLEPPQDDGDDSDDYFLSEADGLEEQVEPRMSSKTILKKLDEALFEIEGLRKLVAAAIEHSTIIPFRWKSNKYLCFYCGSPFSSSTELKQHTTTEHDHPEPKQVLEGVKATTKIKLDVTDITCKKCGLESDNLTDFFEHLTMKHDMKLKIEQSAHLTTFKLADDGMFCPDCGDKFLFFGPMIRHINKYHSKTEMFPCEICGQNFPTVRDVDRHVKAVHNTGSRNTCTKCDKSYSSKVALADHMRRMHRIENLKCPKCLMVLRSPYKKKRHMALVHDAKQYQFKCDICSKTFTFMSKLTRHKSMTHLKERNVICEICGFKVFNKYDLKLHMVKHDDARPFQCGYCDKTFSRKKALDFHIRIHTDDRRYVCKECGKAYIQLASLKIHIKEHDSLYDEGS